MYKIYTLQCRVDMKVKRLPGLFAGVDAAVCEDSDIWMLIQMECQSKLLLYDLLAWYLNNIANTINIICLHMEWTISPKAVHKKILVLYILILQYIVEVVYLFNNFHKLLTSSLSISSDRWRLFFFKNWKADS